MKFSRMKSFLSIGMAAIALSTCTALNAQATSTPPAGSTGLCNDGTYATSSSKSGACRGHKGIKTWYAAAAAPAAKPTAVAPAPAKSATPAASKSSTSTAAPAPGGGPGLVWVNTSTKVYHCPGTQFYGKTKQGSYMSESDAKAKGFRADANKPCTK